MPDLLKSLSLLVDAITFVVTIYGLRMVYELFC